MTSATAWTLLILSGIADVVWAVTTKLSEGYTKPGWTLGSLAALAAFLALLVQALKVLPLGVAYAVWTGIGASGSVVAGLLLFGETLGTGRLLAILAIIGGVAALKILPG
jgi:quaternary ammonium compound-resistance protein SugE